MYPRVISMFLWPNTSCTWIMSLFLWYSVVAFQWRKLWKCTFLNSGLASFLAILRRCMKKQLRISSAFENMRSLLLGILATMSKAFCVRLSNRGSLPFSATMLTVFRPKSIYSMLTRKFPRILRPFLSVVDNRQRFSFPRRQLIRLRVFLSESKGFSFPLHI